MCAVLDAGRSEVSAAMYADDGGQWKTVWDARVVSPEELCSQVDGRPFLRRGFAPCGRDP